jgi:adenylate kinase family enzyme
MISGPSGAGKTWFVNKLIKHRNQMFSTHFNSIYWFYGAVIPKVDNHEKIHFIEGVPETLDIPANSLVILDDLMSETNGNIANLFTKYSHHHNLTVVFIVQNLFPKSKHARDISLNAHYIVVFKNPRDKLQIEYLARQIMPRHSKDVVQIFEEVTRKPHSYLLFDLTQSTHDALRIRTNIFPDETMHVYAHVKDTNEAISVSR